MIAALLIVFWYTLIALIIMAGWMFHRSGEDYFFNTPEYFEEEKTNE